MKKLSFKVEVQANDQPPVQCTQKEIGGDRLEDSFSILAIDCGTFKILEKEETFFSMATRLKEGRAEGQGADKLPNYTLFDKAGERFFFPNSQSSRSSVISCSNDRTRQTSVMKTVLKSDAARVVITRTFIQVRAVKAQF